MDYGIALGLLFGCYIASFPYIRKYWYTCKGCGVKGGRGKWWMEGENQITTEKLRCQYCNMVQTAYIWEDQ